MTELLHEQSEPRKLADIIGYEVDPMEYWQKVQPKLAARGIDLEQYAWQEIARHSEVVAKTAKYGWRSPVAPHLPELSTRIEHGVVTGSMSTQELLEHLAYFRKEVEDARDYYDD